MPNTKNRPARDRAWRRAQRARLLKQRYARYKFDPSDDVRQRGRLAKTNVPNADNMYKEKKWTDLYTRNVKAQRARQLKMLWPRPEARLRELMEDDA